MIGSKQLVLDWQTWLRGMSSGSEIADGGFSDETEAVNLIADPGVVYAPPSNVDGDSDVILTGNIVASIPDHNVADIDSRLLVADDGTFYKYNGTKLQYPNEASAEDSANTFARGFTDAINFAGASFFTSKEKITKWSAASTFDHDYTTSAFANTAYPHPALVFENNAFYGDGNILLRQTTVTGTPTAILTLSSDQVIIALGIDPGTGKMLISTTQTLNISNTLASTNKVHWYDGFSNKTSKTITVEDQVTAFHSHGGNVFVGYGTNLGYLTGSGINFLRNLSNVTLSQADLPYKHNFASIGKTLYVIDGSKVLAYGEAVTGQKIFYYAYKRQSGSGNLTCIMNAGNNKLGFGYATTTFRTINITSKSNMDVLDLYTNWISFGRPVQIRSIDVHFNEAIVSSANWTFSYFDQSSASAITTSLASLHGTQTSVLQINDIVGFTDKLYAVKLRFNNSTSTENKGIKRVVIHYDIVE